MRLIEDTALRQRWLRRHPGEKAFLAFGLLAACLASGSWAIHAAVFAAASAALVLLAGVPSRVYAKLFLLPLSFLIAGVATLFVSLDFNGGWPPTVSLAPEAWAVALPLATRSTAAFSCLLLFSLTTPLPEAFQFFRRCGMPKPVLESALLTYNMFTVLCGSVGRMRTSQEARLGYATLRSSYRSLGLLAANLLTQALARAGRLETGLATRGFDGELRVLVDFSPVSWVRMAGTAALLAALFGAGRML